MKYLIILSLIVLSACEKFESHIDPTPSDPPAYYNPDLEAAIMMISSIIGNRTYVVASIINETTKENAEYLYPGYLGNIYTIPANRIDSINIKPNDHLPSFNIGGWNLSVNVAPPDAEENVNGFYFPIYNRLKGQYTMKLFNKIRNEEPEFKFSDNSAIILRDRYPTGTYVITLLPKQAD